MKCNLSAGDVFQFGDDPSNAGYGQILLSNILQFIVIFEPLLPRTFSVKQIAASLPLLSGWTMDARFQSGDWKVVGSAPLQYFVFPEYQLVTNGKIWTTDVEGKPLRLATEREINKMSFRSSESPIAYERAFKAHHGIIPWEHRFDRLLAEPQIQ